MVRPLTLPWPNNATDDCALIYNGVGMHQNVLIKWKPFQCCWPFKRTFDVFFDLRLNKRLSKHSKRRCFETPSRSLWRHCIVVTWLRTVMSTIKPGVLVDRSWETCKLFSVHCSDVIMGTIASQITKLMIVYSTVYLGADRRKYQSSASLAFVREFTSDRWIPRTNGQ